MYFVSILPALLPLTLGQNKDCLDISKQLVLDRKGRGLWLSVEKKINQQKTS